MILRAACGCLRRLPPAPPRNNATALEMTDRDLALNRLAGSGLFGHESTLLILIWTRLCSYFSPTLAKHTETILSSMQGRSTKPTRNESKNQSEATNQTNRKHVYDELQQHQTYGAAPFVSPFASGRFSARGVSNQSAHWASASIIDPVSSDATQCFIVQHQGTCLMDRTARR